jgi:adenosine deaminase
MNPTGAEALARRRPKMLLHEHFDGGLHLPAADRPGLAAWFDANAHAGSLEQ